MRRKIGITGFLAALATIESGGRPFDYHFERKPQFIPKGHKRFIIDGIEVYALNEKNARRKVAKLLEEPTL